MSYFFSSISGTCETGVSIYLVVLVDIYFGFRFEEGNIARTPGQMFAHTIRSCTNCYIVNQTWKTAIYISLGSLVMSKLGTRGSHKKYISCILVTFSDIIGDIYK